MKFHLVILIYLQPVGDCQRKIYISKISPPIFIDSRKSARDYLKMKVSDGH